MFSITKTEYVEKKTEGKGKGKGSYSSENLEEDESVNRY
jgi:hypothetical protein